MSGNTHFVFRHKVFSVEGSYFSSQAGGRDPCLNIPMGEITATVAIPALRREFAIHDASDDGRLLDVVERALKYLRVIHVNDAIPSELLDGSASWSVEDRHRAAAKCRLAFDLINWATGGKRSGVDLVEFGKAIERPQTKTKVRKAMRKIAEHIGDSSDPLVEVERRIDRLERELSYIEGLRERFQTIRNAMAIIGDESVARGQGQSVKDDVTRIRILLSYAFTKLSSEFELIDKQHQNLLSVLTDMAPHVQLVRKLRDTIHYEMKMWDDISEEWLAYERGGTDGGVSILLGATYRFLAQNYAIVQAW